MLKFTELKFLSTVKGPLNEEGRQCISHSRVYNGIYLTFQKKSNHD